MRCKRRSSRARAGTQHDRRKMRDRTEHCPGKIANIQRGFGADDLYGVSVEIPHVRLRNEVAQFASVQPIGIARLHRLSDPCYTQSSGAMRV